jgi:hypothetical protein
VVLAHILGSKRELILPVRYLPGFDADIRALLRLPSDTSIEDVAFGGTGHWSEMTDKEGVGPLAGIQAVRKVAFVVEKMRDR